MCKRSHTVCILCRAGYVEHVKRAGERVTSFRLSDLTNGQMEYVQRGPLTSVLSLQAWDGEEYSNTVTLR
jgi:hypothetical protein